MSDEEESFVVLGTSSPQGSLLSMGVADKPSIVKSANSTPLSSITIMDANNKSPSIIQAEIADATTLPTVMSQSLVTDDVGNSFYSTGMTNSSNSQVGSSASVKSTPSNLASSFILGEVNADVLKTSVYSQFPSLCSMEACAEDVVKLENLMKDYMDLKYTLNKVNLTMRQFYARMGEWKGNLEQQYKQQLQECQTQLAELRNENLELKRNMDDNMAQIRYADNERQKEHTELIQSISEKTSQINNMRTQIDKLEHQQLTSFEYVSKPVDGDHVAANTDGDNAAVNTEYISNLEHKRIVKIMERQMSVMLAENLELKDAQALFSDEINCLKVTSTAAEELINQLRADIEMLQAKDMEKSEAFIRYENERDQLRDEVNLMRQQVDIYSRDFQIERTSRENIADEKDQLLQDLRALQRKNQDLIEEQRKNLENLDVQKEIPSLLAAASTANKAAAVSSMRALAAAANMKPTSSSSTGIAVAVEPATIKPTKPKPVGKYTCPICDQSCTSLSTLQQHVNIHWTILIKDRRISKGSE